DQPDHRVPNPSGPAVENDLGVHIYLLESVTGRSKPDGGCHVASKGSADHSECGGNPRRSTNDVVQVADALGCLRKDDDLRRTKLQSLSPFEVREETIQT